MFDSTSDGNAQGLWGGSAPAIGRSPADWSDHRARSDGKPVDVVAAGRTANELFKAIGSIVPGVGTVLGGLVGGIVGALEGCSPSTSRSTSTT